MEGGRESEGCSGGSGEGMKEKWEGGLVRRRRGSIGRGEREV